jgi:hypothetical protein
MSLPEQRVGQALLTVVGPPGLAYTLVALRIAVACSPPPFLAFHLLPFDPVKRPGRTAVSPPSVTFDRPCSPPSVHPSYCNLRDRDNSGLSFFSSCPLCCGVI